MEDNKNSDGIEDDLEPMDTDLDLTSMDEDDLTPIDDFDDLDLGDESIEVDMNLDDVGSTINDLDIDLGDDISAESDQPELGAEDPMASDAMDDLALAPTESIDLVDSPSPNPLEADDAEDISLSTDELDNILNTSDDEFFEDLTDETAQVSGDLDPDDLDMQLTETNPIDNELLPIDPFHTQNTPAESQDAVGSNPLDADQDDEDETIALSSDELENILEDVDLSESAGIEGDLEMTDDNLSDHVPASPGSGDHSTMDLDMDMGADTSMDLDMDMDADTSMDLDMDMGAETSMDLDMDMGAETSMDLDMDVDADTSMDMDLADEGASDTTSDPGSDPTLEADAVVSDDFLDDDDTFPELELDDMPPLADTADKSGNVEDDEITLSDEELSQVILDTSDADIAGAMDGDTEEVPMNPVLTSLEIDDDEPIALTAEEMGNIVSEVDMDEDFEDSGQSLDEHSDAMPVVDGEPDSDDEAIALSGDELDHILEDVTDTPIEADGLEFSDTPAESTSAVVDSRGVEDETLSLEHVDKHVINLDDYDESAAKAPDETKDSEQTSLTKAVPETGIAVAETAIADTGGINKAEMRKMISYLDRLFDQLPDETIREFSKSEYFDLYKKIMTDLEL